MQILDGVIERNEVNEKSQGGTELMTEALVKNVGKEALQGYQIVVSRLRSELKGDKHRIYYCHDLPGDPEAQKVLENGNWSNFHKIVFVSHWQQQQFIGAFNIPWHKTTVLKNAIEPINVDVTKKFANRKKPYKIVYHTTPHRGLKLLIPAFDHLTKERDDVELHVYSSFEIYGWGERDEHFKSLFDQMKTNKQIKVHKSVSNDKMKEVLKDMDIFAYPSTWPETSCISLMEAMSAGCICIHPSFAALPETSANWTMMYDFHEDESAHASHFYGFLKNTLEFLDSHDHADNKDSSLLNKTLGQKSYADLYYNWEVRKIEWLGLLNSLKTLPLEFDEAELFGQDEFVYASG